MNISNYESAAHRDDRLRKAARLTAAILGITLKQLDRLVLRIHDHKGEIVVTWYDPPTEAGKLAWLSAWTECGEHSARHNVCTPADQT